MTILSKEVLCKHGPYIDFIDHPTGFKIEEWEWPARKEIEPYIFFDFSENLLEVYCGITRSYAFFDPHTSIQIFSDYDIRKFATKFLDLAKHIAMVRENDLWLILDSHKIYEDALLPDSYEITGENLRTDLIETAIFIANRMIKTAQAKHVLLIDSI